ncbi:DUF3180 family protein [Paenarthrobacter sp. DKR-5]|uniref:DUF3180 domain-containing protein n=1 Tax=Paenarthrobacter sp. DKR-5 TaxID=2835535 RepID=UPI001BDCED88|nr:DUF3180 domain-containing protein [Paenarthrobacter sp. DKR-5]MBT1003280.1 DUF3180 family protein [Paenarthrobacter sp. DKR-5]
MKTLRLFVLLLTAIVSGLVGWVATQITNRASLPTPVLPASSLFTMAVILGVTLVLGIRVWRWRQGKRTRMLNPILAAYTLVLAQACAYVGAVLLGWHGGILFDQLPAWALRSDQTVSLMSLAIMGGGLVMVVVGMIVERFCRIPPEDSGGAGGGVNKRKPEGEGKYA